MIYPNNIHLYFWAKVVCTVVYTLNRTWTDTLPRVTPFEIWYKQKPSVGHMRVFGADSYIHVPTQVRRKLDAKATHGILMGYSTTSKAYRI